jgi:hypothetical protein
MATISNTPRPGYVWDSTDDVWYPIGTGPHTHADYIASGSAINPNVVDAKGDIIAATAADTVARLAVGANDTVLTADSSEATGLKWATPASGGMTLISEVVASALSSLSLSSIPGTYKQLLLVWSGIYHSGSGSEFSLRFNNDSNGSDYKTNALAGTGPTAIASTSRDASHIEAYGTNHNPVPFGNGVNNSTSLYYTMAQGWLEIDNYASTTKYKTFHGDYHYYKNSSTAGYANVQLMGQWEDTAAITSLDIARISGSDTFTNATNTSIRLYGVS